MRARTCVNCVAFVFSRPYIDTVGVDGTAPLYATTPMPRAHFSRQCNTRSMQEEMLGFAFGTQRPIFSAASMKSGFASHTASKAPRATSWPLASLLQQR